MPNRVNKIIGKSGFLIILFIYLFICLFIYLFIYLLGTKSHIFAVQRYH